MNRLTRAWACAAQVISGLGKGVISSSIGAILKACNLRVTAIKIDPYLNIDAGLFAPYEHGEDSSMWTACACCVLPHAVGTM